MTVDLSTVPLVALSVETKQVISTLLNPPKVIPCENGLPRDWRGLAHLCNLDGKFMPLLTSHPDPSGHILAEWEKKKNVTIKNLQDTLEQIDRWDILDDTEVLFEKDAEQYLERLQRCQTSSEILQNDLDAKVLTVDDLHRMRQGLENQYYDAFLLYAEEDISFATEMINKLENQYDLKLCIKDRDLIGGVTFEHEAVMTLISERCNRLIVIVSSNFLKSPANKFFLNYAQALGIDKRQRKIVPCLYEKCQLPPQLSYMFILDYNRVGLYDFWGKLRDSVQAPNSVNKNVKSLVPIKENPPNPEAENSQNNNTTSTNDIRKTPQQNNQEPVKTVNTEIEDKSNVIQTTTNSISNDLHYPRSSNKKPNNLLEWTRKKWNRKPDNLKKEYEPMTESLTIPSLPSLNGLDELSTSAELVEKQEKSKFINKYVKKVKLKKILVKS